MMNSWILPQIFDFYQKVFTKKMQSGIFILMTLIFSQNLLQAEGSVDFINNPGKRLFYWANESQQIKVYANAGEYLNIGASHIGVNNGFAILYRPDGSFAAIYQNTGAGAGLGIINNNLEELHGPTGGGTLSGDGYIPIVQPVSAGEDGIWTIYFGFPSSPLPSSSSYAFTNLENNETWDRTTHQPNEWAIVSWDVTVSTTAASNEGGTMLTGRVFTNQYKSIITGNSNTTSPNFYMLSKEGIQYELNFNEIDPYGFQFSANSSGIVNGNGQPIYGSKLNSEITYSNDPMNWAANDFYIYDPQSPDQNSFSTYKIFFNPPANDMPVEAMSTNPFTNETYTTWLMTAVSPDVFDIQSFDFVAVDDQGYETCFGNNIQVGEGGKIKYNSSVNGSSILSLDLNNDGDFLDSEDRMIYQAATIGDNEIIWDGNDGMGITVPLETGVEINYKLEMRAGEMHIIVEDVENNTGGVAFTQMNGLNSPSNDFYFDHSNVGGSTSGGGAPSVAPTTIPFTYDSNWGNNKTLDYWAYQTYAGTESGKWIVNVVSDCSKPNIVDTDLDGIDDDVDLDDDNDGIPDTEEYCNGAVGFSCFTNGVDPSGDEDNDNVPNVYDADDAMVNNPCIDADNNGVCDAVASIYDTDGDNVPDHIDLDSDNDGIPDLVEAVHNMDDVDQDGRIDGVAADFGDNGLFNNISSDPNSPTATLTYTILNTSNNAVPDHDDLDADADGIFDVLESPQVDGDFDGIVGTGNPKVDANGLPLQDGNGATVFISFLPKNLDLDAAPDYRDWDRDNDGIADSYECPNPMDCVDTDNDGQDNIDDLDSDNDNLTDQEECPTGIPCADLDLNNVDDFLEVTTINCGGFGTPVVTAVDEVICAGEVLALSTDPIVGTGVVYEWFYDNGTNSFSLGLTGTPSYFVNFTNPTHTGAYSVQAKSGPCSTPVSNAVNINVYATSSPIAENTTTSSAPICEGESLQLSVPYMIDATYEWFGPNGFTSDQYDPVITSATTADAGSYYAVVTMSDNCATLFSTNTTAFVQAVPAPAGVENVNPICEGSDLTLTANPLGVPPNVNMNFEWFYENGTSIGVTNDTEFILPNITSAAAGDYYVVMTVGNCEAGPSSMVTVEITDTDVAEAGNDQSICGLGNTNLVATMPSVGTGQWTSTTGAIIFDPTLPESAVTNLSVGNNVFVWTISNGNCFNYATDTVVINYTDVTNDEANAGMDLGICNDSEVILNATTPTSAFGVWTQSTAQAQMGINISNNTSTTPIIDGMVPGNSYVFTWTLSEGTCFNYDADDILITVSDLPNISANVDSDEEYTCGENEINISATIPSVGTGAWMTTSDATIVDPNNAITSVDDVQIGENMFVWTLSNGACENYDSDTMYVFLEEAIEVEDDNFTLALNDRLENKDVLVNDFIGWVNEYEINITQPTTQGTVDMTDGIFTYIPNHNAYGTDEFVYEVCNVNCATECKTATVTIEINGLTEKGDCWIPNVLTPNGNGKNDALVIPCTENFPNNELIIFNRWGDKVFEETGYGNDWDGTYKGSDLPAGTYYYVFKLDGTDAEPVQGFFSLVR